MRKKRGPAHANKPRWKNEHGIRRKEDRVLTWCPRRNNATSKPTLTSHLQLEPSQGRVNSGQSRAKSSGRNNCEKTFNRGARASITIRLGARHRAALAFATLMFIKNSNIFLGAGPRVEEGVSAGIESDRRKAYHQDEIKMTPSRLETHLRLGSFFTTIVALPLKTTGWNAAVSGVARSGLAVARSISVLSH